MTTTYCSLYLHAQGQDFLWTVSATDGAEATLVNHVSSQGIGDTFSTGATITKCGPLILNSKRWRRGVKSPSSAQSYSTPIITWLLNSHTWTPRPLRYLRRRTAHTRSDSIIASLY